MQEQQNINQVELALYNAFNRQFILFPEERIADKKTTLELLTDEARSVNYHVQLFNTSEISKQWNRIRSNDAITTALLSITTDFVNELELNGLRIETVTLALAKSIGIINVSESLIDDVLVERAPSPDDLKRIFSDNVWVVTMYYISRSVHVYALFLEAASPKPRGKRT